MANASEPEFQQSCCKILWNAILLPDITAVKSGHNLYIHGFG